MTNITDLGIAAIRDGVAKGAFSATEVATAFNAAVEAAQPALNAFIVTTPEKALEAAAKVDADRAAGKPLGPMAGVPIGMKDLFATKGTQTTAASKILQGYTSTYDATVIKKLRAAGAIPFGRCNLDEFAMGSSTENSEPRAWKRQTPFVVSMSYLHTRSSSAGCSIAPVSENRAWQRARSTR